MRNCLILGYLVLLILACSKNDSIQSKIEFVQIGSQTWAKTNLDVATFRNGDPIPEVKSAEEWSKAGKNGKPAWCYYENDSSNGEKFGKLYNWYSVSDSRGICPTGWHVPSDAEWTTLTDNLGGEGMAGLKMKSTDGWADGDNGTNRSGFSGLPGGQRNKDGTFAFIGSSGYWRSSTEYSSSYAWLRLLFRGGEEVVRGLSHEHHGVSVRCLRD